MKTLKNRPRTISSSFSEGMILVYLLVICTITVGDINFQNQSFQLKVERDVDGTSLDIHFVEDTSVLFAEHDVQIVWHIRYSSRL